MTFICSLILPGYAPGIFNVSHWLIHITDQLNYSYNSYNCSPAYFHIDKIYNSVSEQAVWLQNSPTHCDYSVQEVSEPHKSTQKSMISSYECVYIPWEKNSRQSQDCVSFFLVSDKTGVEVVWFQLSPHCELQHHVPGALQYFRVSNRYF